MEGKGQSWRTKSVQRHDQPLRPHTGLAASSSRSCSPSWNRTSLCRMRPSSDMDHSLRACPDTLPPELMGTSFEGLRVALLLLMPHGSSQSSRQLNKHLVLAQPPVPSIPSSSHLQYLLLDLLQHRSLCLAPRTASQSTAVGCRATRVPSLGGTCPTSAGVLSRR